MDTLKMHSPNLVQDHIARLRELFPGCVTETKDEKGIIKLAVDFDQLRQELSESIVEGPQERYRLDWPGKREALLLANAPIARTLRPCRKESIDFDTTKNLFIEGDNLDALKLLQENYLGKIKMIYIDPPYNTGNDHVYEDDFSEKTDNYLRRSNQKDGEGSRLVANTAANGRFHSDWLSMMYSRLKLALNVISDDGLIFISIDDNEVQNLRRICDEIFGEENFIDPIIWKKRYGGGAKEKFLVALHEYILVYAKQKESLDNFLIPLPDESIKRYYKNSDENFNIRGPYRTHPLEAMKSFDTRENLNFPIPAPDGTQVWPKRQWRWGEDRVKVALARNEIEFGKDRSGNWILSSKQYLNDADGEVRGTKPFSIIDDVFTQHGTNEILEIFGNAKVFDFSKPSSLIRKLITIGLNGSNEGVILDFFAGSSATAHAVMQLNAEDGGNRQFIMVQLPEPCEEKSEAFKAGYKTIAEISKERIRRAGSKILQGECHKDWNKDIGFRILKIDTSNMADVHYSPDALGQAHIDSLIDNIKPDRTAEDLLLQVMLDWGVDLALPIAHQVIQGKEVFLVDGNALAACFDAHGGVDEPFVKELAQLQPLRVVFRDAGFKDSAMKINVEQIFKLLSPSTEVKCL
jgi:adenine-specific DNA-methyltransferase